MRDRSGSCADCGGSTWGREAKRCRSCWAKTLPAPSTKPNWRTGQAKKNADVEWLRRWAAAHAGRSPSLSEWTRSRPNGAPGVYVYKKTYGSWVAAIEAAGLPPRPLDGEGRWASEAERSRRDTRADQRNRQMVTAGGHDEPKRSWPGRLIDRHPRRRRHP
jgi:hypothetical protein